MLSSVSRLLLRFMIYRSVVYRNRIGVMNIQLAEEYKTCREGGKGAWVFGQSEPGLEREGHWSQGSREGVGAGGPNSEDGVRAGAPREEGCSKEYEHEEEEGLKRT